jgi:hypothetical protein
MRRETSGIVLLRVYCDLCESEGGVRSSGRVGMITRILRDPTEPRVRPGINWTAENPRGAPGVKHRPFQWAGRALRNNMPHDPDPDELPAYCRHHGWRRLKTADVLAAVDSRVSKVVLTSTAQPK